MANDSFIKFLSIRLCQLALNLTVLFLYRNGDSGQFMGASHNKSFDHEIMTTGIFIGFFIYTCVKVIGMGYQRLSYATVKTCVSESIMSFAGGLLWLITSALIIQWWISYTPGDHFIRTTPRAAGIIMGVIALLNSGLHFGDFALSFRMNYREYKAVPLHD